MLEVWEVCSSCGGEGEVSDEVNADRYGAWARVECGSPDCRCCLRCFACGDVEVGANCHPGYVRVLRPVAEVLRAVIDPGLLPT